MPNWWGRVHLFIYFVKKMLCNQIVSCSIKQNLFNHFKKVTSSPSTNVMLEMVVEQSGWEDETRNKRGLCDGISVTRHTLCEWVRSLTGEIELPLGQIHKPPPWRCNPVPLWSPPSTLCPPDSVVGQEIQSWVENKLPIITTNENWLEATVKRMQQTSKSKWSEMASQSKQ